MDEHQLTLFMRKVDKDLVTGCWNWNRGLRKDNYANFRVKADGKWKTQLAHRVSYTHFVGHIPDKLVLDHLCRNRSCVNPEHLEAVTFRENVLRGVGVTAINARKTTCPNGHNLSGDNLSIEATGRRCRTCKNLRNKLWKLKARQGVGISKSVCPT